MSDRPHVIKADQIPSEIARTRADFEQTIAGFRKQFRDVAIVSQDGNIPEAGGRMTGPDAVIRKVGDLRTTTFAYPPTSGEEARIRAMVSVPDNKPYHVPLACIEAVDQLLDSATVAARNQQPENAIFFLNKAREMNSKASRILFPRHFDVPGQDI